MCFRIVASSADALERRGRKGCDMVDERPEAPDSTGGEAECFECGIRLEAAELAEIEGETLCWQCAEEYLRESDAGDPAASLDDPLSDRGAQLH
jgi:hypothetical protein